MLYYMYQHRDETMSKGDSLIGAFSDTSGRYTSIWQPPVSELGIGLKRIRCDGAGELMVERRSKAETSGVKAQKMLGKMTSFCFRVIYLPSRLSICWSTLDQYVRYWVRGIASPQRALTVLWHRYVAVHLTRESGLTRVSLIHFSHSDRRGRG